MANSRLRVVTNENEDSEKDNEMEDNTNGTEQAKERLVIGVSVSNKLGGLVEKWATEHNITIAAVARQALAQFLGYDLSQEPSVQRGARAKYATKEEAAEAQKAKVAERNELIKKLLAEYRERTAKEAADLAAQTLDNSEAEAQEEPSTN